MQNVRSYVSSHWRLLLVIGLGLALTSMLLLYRLGSLVNGLSSGEVAVANTPLGWHGLYNQPLYLPLKLVRSIIFFLTAQHGQTLTRLANTVFGILSIATFATVVRAWHDRRTALLAVALFMTSSWTLHVSRLASYDVLYLGAVPLLMLGYVLRQRHPKSTLVFYGSALSWSALLFIPGLVWLVLLTIIVSWQDICDGWSAQRAWWRRLLFVGAGIAWLPLLLPDFLRSTSDLLVWLGLPTKFPGLTSLGKQLLAVPIHLLVRGPAYPAVWLGRLPILDATALVLTIIGGYFYYSHWRARRARKLALILVVGTILIGLGGPVSLSLLVPVLFLLAAAGLHTLLKSWLRVFPHNPIARSLGISLLVIAVSGSSLYNLRAYFVAWPHNATTHAVFHYRR
jgi:hypothetical protein